MEVASRSHLPPVWVREVVYIGLELEILWLSRLLLEEEGEVWGLGHVPLLDDERRHRHRFCRREGERMVIGVEGAAGRQSTMVEEQTDLETSISIYVTSHLAIIRTCRYGSRVLFVII